jgi:hypothetical protein
MVGCPNSRLNSPRAPILGGLSPGASTLQSGGGAHGRVRGLDPSCRHTWILRHVPASARPMGMLP